tara:strand:- start:286 stop:525 length:240 start_codon:yes stop_codon:yes gene_type:complete
MPFKSEKQRKYLFANKPEIAKRWTKEYATGGMIKKAIANNTKLAGYSHMRAGGMISNGSLTPPKVVRFQDLMCRKARES